MNFLFNTSAYKPAFKQGGPLHSVSALAEEIVRRGHQVWVKKILLRLRQDFYHKLPPQTFYRDQHLLTQAITWPAAWLHQRGLHLRPEAYQQLIHQRLDEILKHGDPSTCQAYFPRYLMHCLQKWFQHNGDHLCDELRHVRNQLWQVDAIVRAIQNTQPPDRAYTQNLALTHHCLSRQKRRKADPGSSRQLTLI